MPLVGSSDAVGVRRPTVSSKLISVFSQQSQTHIISLEINTLLDVVMAKRERERWGWGVWVDDEST